MPVNDLEYTYGHERDSIERRLDAVERALADDESLERADPLDDFETGVVETTTLRLWLVRVEGEAVVRVERAAED